jgi:hypothetical protein
VVIVYGVVVVTFMMVMFERERRVRLFNILFALGCLLERLRLRQRSVALQRGGDHRVVRRPSSLAGRPMRFARLATSALGLCLIIGVAAPAGAAGPGSLPQTRSEPSFGTPFQRQMNQLFRAIKNDSNAIGATAFFPEAAYVSMKTGEIPSPSSDYADRLVHLFDLDLAAYHSRIFNGAKVTFVHAIADAHDAQWIAPGVCENKIGYWHVPGVRLVLRRGTRLISVAVFSLISWRGVSYVVHLGPNPRPVDVGTVDDFESGAGRPGPPGGC